MSADQLIAELKALPLTERQQIITAVLSDGLSSRPDMRAAEQNDDFVEHWQGKFALPQSDSTDARLTYLLDRFSS